MNAALFISLCESFSTDRWDAFHRVMDNRLISPSTTNFDEQKGKMIGEGLISLKFLFLSRVFFFLFTSPGAHGSAYMGSRLPSVYIRLLSTPRMPSVRSSFRLPAVPARGNTRQQTWKDGTALDWQGFVRRRIEGKSPRIGTSRTKRSVSPSIYLVRGSKLAQSCRATSDIRSRACVNASLPVLGRTENFSIMSTVPLFFSSRERNARTLRSSVSYPRSTGAFLPDDDVREDKATAGSWTPGRDSRMLKYNVFYPPVPHFSRHALRNFARACIPDIYGVSHNWWCANRKRKTGVYVWKK